MFLTPASLLDRLRKPEETTAWGRFVELYTPLLFHWAQQLGQQDADCADLVQDVFLILWRKLPEFEYDSAKSFHAWLKTLFLNRRRALAQRQARSRRGGAGCRTLVPAKPCQLCSSTLSAGHSKFAPANSLPRRIQ